MIRSGARAVEDKLLKLSPFNLTTFGKVSRQLVPGAALQTVCQPMTVVVVWVIVQDDDIATTERESLPTLHEVAQKCAVESWKKIRLDMLRIAILGITRDQLCTASTADKALYCCLQCGPIIFFCSQC